MKHKIWITKLKRQNRKYLNTFKMCVDSWQYCANTWFYFVGCTWAVVFQVFRSVLYSIYLSIYVSWFISLFSIALFLFSFFLNLFYWSIVDLQCCVNFCCTAKWFSYTYTYILFHILFHYGLSQDTECSSLCYTVGPCCLSILCIIVCIC